MLDETSKMMRNLSIISRVALGRRGNGAGRTGLIDFNDIGRNGRLHAPPDERAGGDEAKPETAKRHQPPVPGLHTGRPDTLVPDLPCFLEGRFRKWAWPIACGRSFEDHSLVVLVIELRRSAR